MKTKTISWVAVLAETTLVAWSRESGAVRVVARPVSGGMMEAWTLARAQLLAQEKGTGVVVASDVFAQALRLPEVQTAGLSEGEIGKVLAFEAEPFSQISAQDAFLAWEKKSADTVGVGTWNVLEMSRSEAVSILRDARQNRLRVESFSVLPEAWLARTAEEWSRPEMASRVAAWAETLPTLRLKASEATGERASAKEGASVRQVSLTVALFVVLGLYAGLDVALGRAKKELREREVAAERVQRLQEEVQAAQRALSEHAAAEQTRRENAALLARYQKAWAVLLEGLETTSEEGVVIEKISERGPFSVLVEGYGLDAEKPVRMMEALSVKGAASGWQVQPGMVQEGARPGFSKFTFTAELQP